MRRKDKLKAKVKKGKLSMFATLLTLSLMPMILLVVTVGIIGLIQARRAIRDIAFNYMYSMAKTEGEGLEEEVAAYGTDKALSMSGLKEYCADIALQDVPSSYCYVADADGIMLYHPTAEKIKMPVSNCSLSTPR